ncbi:MAG: hypothetical protein QGF67_09640, partial [Lentisphaeria bacterium]|nr:hypothetical protein [Lentisphaeria bacterium]
MTGKEDELHLALPVNNPSWLDGPKETERLIEFCRRIGVDTIQTGIMRGLMGAEVCPQEFFPGESEIKSLREKHSRVTRPLKAAGFWLVLDLPTLLHGFELARHPFKRMVGITGNQLESPCPLDPQWQDYICGFFASFADVGYDWLWPDDDFRMDNHIELHACYCSDHLETFSHRYGHRLTREEIRGILQKRLPISGAEEKIKSDWFEFKRLNLEEVAGKISQAIHQVNKACGFGGTLAGFDTASLGGCKVRTLLQKMAGQGNRIHARVGCGGYRDYDRTGKLQAMYAGLLQKMLLPHDAWVFSEHSCWPTNRFNRSATDFLFQMVHAVSHGYKHLLLFPNIREGTVYRGQIERHLPFLKNLSRAIPRDSVPSGAALVYTEECAFYQGLDETRVETGHLAYECLSRLGIPLRLVEAGQVETVPGPFIVPGNVVMRVWDQFPWLIRNGLLLDGEAVELLAAHDRLSGLGVTTGEPINTALREYFRPGFLNGPDEPAIENSPLRVFRDLWHHPFLRLVPEDQKWQVTSEFHDASQNCVGPELMVKSDEHGRIAVTASCFRHDHQGFLNQPRQRQ